MLVRNYTHPSCHITAAAAMLNRSRGEMETILEAGSESGR